MKLKFKIRNQVKIIASLAVLFVIIGFSERQQNQSTIKDIEIKIDNFNNNHFIDEQDIVRLMELGYENLKGAPLSRVNLKQIETRIKSDRFVKDAELYSDIKGNLVVRTTLQRPIARIVRSDGPGAYIAEDGTIMPISGKFTSRVVLISGSFAHQFMKSENIYNHDAGEDTMKLLEAIREDNFWSAQITQLDFDRKGRIFLLPQVGSQIVEFGYPEGIDTKLKKLKIFYKEILPQMGWNKYKRISLEFEGQIVAE